MRAPVELSSVSRRLSWWVVIIPACLALLFCGLGMLGASRSGLSLGFAPLFPFVNPSSAILGPDGLIVVNDSGDRRIVGLGPGGELRFVIPGQRRSGGFYNGRAVGFDREGRFYVDDTILDLETGNAHTEVLRSFDGRGRLLGSAFTKEYSQEESADVVSRMIYTQASEDFISWFYPDAAGGWSLHVKELGGKASPPPRSFADYDVYATVDALLTPSRTAWFLERSGRILRAGPDSPVEAWYEDLEGRIRFPVALVAGPGEEIYVLDGKLALLRVREGESGVAATTVLDREIAAKAGYDKPFALSSCFIGPDGSICAVNEASGELLLLAPDGRLVAYGGARLNGAFAVLRLVLLLAWVLGLSSGLVALILYMVKVFGMKTRLLLRQLSILVPLTALAAGGIAWSVYGNMNESLEKQLGDRLRHLAQLLAQDIPVGALDGIDPSADKLDEILGAGDYLALSEAFDAIVNRNEDSWNSNVFPYAYFRRGGEWFVVGGFDYLELYPTAWTRPEFAAVYDKGERTFSRYEDIYGAWLSAMVPLLRDDGSVAAVVEASMSADFLDELAAATLQRIAFGTAGLLALLVTLFAVFDWFLLRSVKALREGAERVSEGDYGVKVDIRSRDEIEELGTAFNAMSGQIQGYVERLDRYGKANARFVPKEFLSQLGRESIMEIGLGDQVLTEMSIMFSDIRSFTSLSEGMGPSATMDMLNDYLSRMGPAVRHSGGFIDKYVGDAIMALFPRSPADAVEAVLAMMDALDVFRSELAERGEPAVEAGFGIHVGSLMLGIIGEAERFEGTVIADAVNLAARLESLTRFYGVRAIMSGSVRDALEPDRRVYRFLDLVTVKGKSEPVRIYELIGAGDPERLGKLGSAAAYVRGFEDYRRSRFDAAIPSFEAALASCPGDAPASLFLERCRHFALSGAPSGFRGITEFHEK
jgi:class 3 adenylate cyclase/HAMP domain-containing protein